MNDMFVSIGQITVNPVTGVLSKFIVLLHRGQLFLSFCSAPRSRCLLRLYNVLYILEYSPCVLFAIMWGEVF